MAFDHEQIVLDAADRIRSKLEYTALAARFCPPMFTISQLRRVYEVVWGARFDPGNFHHDFVASGAFERRAGVAGGSWSGRGRPGALWSVRDRDGAAPFAAALERPPAKRGRPTRRRTVDDRRGGVPRPPRREFAALLREAVEAYDFPQVVYDFREARDFQCGDMLGVEEHIGALLRSPEPDHIRDGLSNVLYWGYARQPQRRVAKIRDFRHATPDGDPKLHGFAEVVASMGERPLSSAAGPTLLDFKRLMLRQFGQMSFVTGRGTARVQPAEPHSSRRTRPARHNAAIARHSSAMTNAACAP